MIIQEIQKLSPSNLITLYSLDLSTCRGKFGQTTNDVYRWCDGVNDLGNDIVWAGQTYTRYPIEATGFSKDGGGEMVRPRLAISNISYVVGNRTRELNDLLGARLKRVRTFARYLDAVNFSGGNPNADTNAILDTEIWILDRKTMENAEVLEWELAAPFDVIGVSLPKRKVIQNVCPWKYRGTECGYVGSKYFKIDDTPTLNPAEDVCGKRISSCKLRFEHTVSAGVDTSKNTVLVSGTVPSKAVFIDNSFDPFFKSYAVWANSSGAMSPVEFSVYFPTIGDYWVVLTSTVGMKIEIGGLQVLDTGTAGNLNGFYTNGSIGMKTVKITNTNMTSGSTPGVAAIIDAPPNSQTIFNLKTPFINNATGTGTGVSSIPFGGFPGVGLTY